ncbi:MAG TPA: hypothetical protein VKB26_09275 [Candidatus Acidoferrales bacterium]|nr:hypothetical protein [Candidatus Acidoferrales bacterium]
MSTEIRRTKMEITSDARLRAGVRAALEHICERHGISEKDRQELSASIENECANGGANCAVTIDEMDDRVEVHVASTQNSKNSREANAAGHQSAPHTKTNNDGARTFVKHFQKNAARS